MTIANMRLFRFTSLAIPDVEPGDVVYAGPNARELQLRADDEAAKADARGDSTSGTAWRTRSTKLGVVQQIAPNTVGIRWRESAERIYFIVPNLGHVQSLEVDQFLMEFAGARDASLYDLIDRGINAVYELVESWGWSRR